MRVGWRVSLPWILVAVALQATAAPAQSLTRNGSFEEGSESPTGWKILHGARWALGDAHSGKRYVSGKTARSEFVCVSDNASVEPNTDYRLEGWVRAPAGTAALRVDLVDGDGKIVGAHSAPSVSTSSRWQYVAAEWNSGLAKAARVTFVVKGRADLDDVQLAPIATSYIGNPGVEPDARGRVGFWSEERSDSLLSGRRAGAFRPDPEMKHEGKASLQLTATGDWYAWSSLNYAVPAWTQRVRLGGWVRCDKGAVGQILACWSDDLQRVLRVDASEEVRGDRQGAAQIWQPVRLAREAPPNAAAVRIVAVTKTGRVWFDDFELLRLRPRQRIIRVFVNQVGYEQEGPKSVIVATNFFPAQRSSLVLRVTRVDGKVVLTEPVSCSGRVYNGRVDDWGWYFWRADFTSLSDAGRFRAVAEVEGVRTASPPFVVSRGALLGETAQPAVDFFFIQRCGFEVPGWHKPCHLDDAKLPDGTHVDLTGGWHSAGDYNKLMYEHGDGGVAFALLSAYRAAPAMFRKFDRNSDGVCDILDEAEWGARFVAKMQIPETGGVRNHVNQGPARDWMKWLAPDVHTDNLVGTNDDPVVQPGEGNSPLVIGAWVRLSALLGDRGISNDYLARAVRLWSHASNDGTQVSPHLLLSALELHTCTRDQRYLEAARRGAQSILTQQVQHGRMRGAFGTYGEIIAGALAQFALAYPKDPLVANIKPALRAYIDFCISTADNPFGISKHVVGDTESFFPPDMGANFLLLARAWAAASIYRLNGDRRALVYATDHMDWILGKNPLNLCMFEGKGECNPPRYHHRYNMIPGHERGAVPGCVPNGMVKDLGLADRPGFDLSRTGGRSPSFRTSEPWLVHNLYFLLALGELHRAVSR